MGSFSSGIADAIRRMGDAQAQGALQKGQIYGNLAHDLGQAPMNYLALQRGINENKHREVVQGEQERKIKNDQELVALLAQTPPADKMRVSMEFWQQRDPAKYHEAWTWMTQAATEQFNATQGTPGRTPMQAGVEAQLPANALGPPVPLEQQQVPHAPVHFPGGYGQEPFDAVPQTQQQMGIRELIKTFQTAQSKRAGEVAGEAGKERVYAPGSTIDRPGQPREMMPFRPEASDKTLSPTELFAKDPRQFEAMKETEARIGAKYRKPDSPDRPSASQEMQKKRLLMTIKSKKDRALAALEREYRSPAAFGRFDPMSDEELLNRKQQIQNDFEDDLSSAGFEATPFSYSDQSRQLSTGSPKTGGITREQALQELRRRGVVR